MSLAIHSPGELARVACLLEVMARKPGNVHRFRDFDDAHLIDFLLSASAISRGIDLARERGVGVSVLAAVEDVSRFVATNTNFGMILLLAPLAAIPDGVEPRQGVGRVLAATTVEDARLVYRAIRLARPGGLGTADAQDVSEEPTVTLVEAMRLAADRDLVARQYADNFAEVFDPARATLRASIDAGHSLETAIVATHLTLMARFPDTLIARKRGPKIATESARRASELLAIGWPDAPESLARFQEFDAWLRDDGHARNPGTTADLVCAALFLTLREGKIEVPSHWSRIFNDGSNRLEP